MDGNGEVLSEPVRRHLTLLTSEVDQEDIVAVVLFGSAARGDDDEQSDIDILIVVAGRDPQRTIVGKVVGGPRTRVSPIVMTLEGLIHEGTMRPSFIAHLLDEAVIVQSTPRWETVVPVLREAASNRDALACEIQRRVRAVETYQDPERFEASPVTVLSHLYAIARSVVIARLLEEGVHEYNWHRIFDAYAELKPYHKRQIETLKNLRPYYEFARSRNGARLPEGTARADVAELVISIRQLAG